MSTGGPGHTHEFDPDSGWCAWCNLRDDGRLVTKAGTVIHQGQHDTEQDEQNESAQCPEAPTRPATTSASPSHSTPS